MDLFPHTHIYKAGFSGMRFNDGWVGLRVRVRVRARVRFAVCSLGFSFTEYIHASSFSIWCVVCGVWCVVCVRERERDRERPVAIFDLVPSDEG